MDISHVLGTNSDPSHGVFCLCPLCGPKVEYDILNDTYKRASSGNASVSGLVANKLMQNGAGARNMGAQSMASGVVQSGAAHQSYKMSASAKPYFIVEIADEARIVEFVVGVIPPDSYISGKDCYSSFKHIPEGEREDAMVLHAAISGSEDTMVNIKGFGSIRKLFGSEDVFYVRLCR